MSHLWSARSAEPTTGVTTASIIRWRGSPAGRRGRSFFGRPEHGLLAFALTPPLRRHSDPEDRQPRVRASPYNPEDPAMLSLYPFAPKLTRLGVAACGLAALAACGDNPISGPTLDPSLSRVAGFYQLKRSEEHTSELQSPCNLVCRLLLEKKKKKITNGLHMISSYITA